ncbi:aminopeptidase N [Hamadaea tsunoensis]|uniref:aminopeptidase N n=1 Tax=Hamadaea tsunoensis TaxID=53368 RepID=UPI000422194F|nr:aminopeptidase N [Hamadaea tsunoensis]
MASLTHDQATARVAVVRDVHYDLDLDLTGEETFRATTVVRFEADPGHATFLELRPSRFASATLNGRSIDAYADGRLPLADLEAVNEVVVTAEYAYSHTGEGLHRFTDPADGLVYIYAQPAIADAPMLMACFDQPDIKAVFRLAVTADPTWTVRSNTAPVAETPGRWTFAPTKPMSTYLITLIAGPYAEVADEHDGIPMSVFARSSYAAALAENAPEIFEITKACLDRYHELFGLRYPFGKYDQAFVPDFTWGAMEFPGLVVFRDEVVYRSAVTDTQRARRASIIAHEMAHMWFGDLVTMRWWDDLWLNESFATYMGTRLITEVTRFTEGWSDFSIDRKIWGYAADQRPSTHPIAPEFVADTGSAYANFDGISYAKGCSALRQLVAFVGDEAFFTGLRAHFEKHAWGNATLDDLLAALSLASGRDLGEWARVWLRSAGVNTLRPVVSFGADGTVERFAVEQSAPAACPTLRPHKIEIGYTDATGTRRRIEADVDGPLTEVPALTGVTATDVLLNAGDLTFAKVRLDPSADPGRLLSTLDSSLDRAVTWASLWDCVRDGELPAAEFVRLVAEHLPNETNVSILETVGSYAGPFAVDQYLAPERRADADRALVSAYERIVAANDGRLLAAARLVIGRQNDPAALRAFAPAGLEIDADLRWLILARLAALGDLSAAEIDAAAAADPTERGVTKSAYCRAARPDIDAKRTAFDLLLHDRTQSNRILQAVGQAFWRPGQEELMEPFVEPFLAGLPATGEWRSGALQSMLAGTAFPAYAVSQSTVDAAEALLARDDLHTMLRRSIMDDADDLRRSLRQREL